MTFNKSALAMSAIWLLGCQPEITHDHDPYDPADEETITETEQAATVLAAPIAMRSGSWWGDTATPLVNQVWGEVLNATPGKNLTAPFTFKWTCDTPKFSGFAQTLKLTNGSFSVDSTVVKSFASPLPGQVLSYTLDPAKFSAGWHEIRIRCKAKETVGGETDEVTAITAGFPLQLRGGTTAYQNHSGTNYVDTHGWYDRGVNYVYATILNISEIVGRPQSGVIALSLKARRSGDTVLDHFMVKVDDKIAIMSNGLPAEFSGTTDRRTIYLDTRRWANGTHTLSMHSHGLETSSSEAPGKQLAAQIDVTIQIQNP